MEDGGARLSGSVVGISCANECVLGVGVVIGHKDVHTFRLYGKSFLGGTATDEVMVQYEAEVNGACEVDWIDPNGG